MNRPSKKISVDWVAMAFAIVITIVAMAVTDAADGAPSKPRSFKAAEGATTLKLSEQIELSATQLAPDLDPATGRLKGLAASGDVLIRLKPDGSEQWIVVHCDKASYDLAEDVILLSGWPAVKRGVQVLRATASETYVRVARKSGKWEIKGPHRIEISLR